jgi:hypothetical protein
MGRVIDHERPWVDAFEHVRGGDIAHVEGRILPEQHNIHVPEIDALLGAKRDVVALDVTHLRGFGHGNHLAIAHRELVGRIGEQCVPAPRRFQHKGKARIARDPDALDRVHLHGNGQFHGLFPCAVPGVIASAAKQSRVSTHKSWIASLRSQ